MKAVLNLLNLESYVLLQIILQFNKSFVHKIFQMNDINFSHVLTF